MAGEKVYRDNEQLSAQVFSLTKRVRYLESFHEELRKVTMDNGLNLIKLIEDKIREKIDVLESAERLLSELDDKYGNHYNIARNILARGLSETEESLEKIEQGQEGN